MNQHFAYLAKAAELATMASRTADPLTRRTLKEMEEIYRLLAQLAAGSQNGAAEHQPAEDTPFYSVLMDGSGRPH